MQISLSWHKHLINVTNRVIDKSRNYVEHILKQCKCQMAIFYIPNMYLKRYLNVKCLPSSIRLIDFLLINNSSIHKISSSFLLTCILNEVAFIKLNYCFYSVEVLVALNQHLSLCNYFEFPRSTKLLSRNSQKALCQSSFTTKDL